MVEGEGELRLERAKAVASFSPRGQRRLCNLAVNPTQGSRDEQAAWESFRDTKCRKKKLVQSWFPAPSDSMLK